MLSLIQYKEYISNNWEEYLHLPEVKASTMPDIDLLVSLAEIRFHIEGWINLIIKEGSDTQEIKFVQSVLIDVIICLKLCRASTNSDRLKKQYDIVIGETSEYNSKLVNQLDVEFYAQGDNHSKIKKAFSETSFHEDLLKDQCYSSI